MRARSSQWRSVRLAANHAANVPDAFRIGSSPSMTKKAVVQFQARIAIADASLIMRKEMFSEASIPPYNS